MSSTKLLAVVFIVCVLGYFASATDNDNWDDDANASENAFFILKNILFKNEQKRNT